MQTGFTDDRPGTPIPPEPAEAVVTLRPEDFTAYYLFVRDRRMPPASQARRYWLPRIALAAAFVVGGTAAIYCGVRSALPPDYEDECRTLALACFADLAALALLAATPALRRGAWGELSRRSARRSAAARAKQSTSELRFPLPREERVVLTAEGATRVNERELLAGGVVVRERRETFVPWWAVREIAIIGEHAFVVWRNGALILPAGGFADGPAWQAFVDAACRLHEANRGPRGAAPPPDAAVRRGGASVS
jgi:hypothetical protein